MQEFEHKGYTIRTFDSEMPARYHVMALDEGFRGDGYATLNNAKGAITKYLKAKADVTPKEAISRAMVAEIKELRKLKAATNVRPAYVSVPVPVLQSRNKREGGYVGKGQIGKYAGKHCRAGVRPTTKTLKQLSKQ